MNPEEQAKRRALRRWVKLSGAALLAAFAVLLLSTLSSSREAKALRMASSQRIALNQYLTDLRAAVELVTDAETAQRGYLLTGKPSYLEPYRQALDEIGPTLESLERPPLVSVDLGQHVALVRVLTEQKMAELARTIELYDSGDARGALDLVKRDVGQHAMSDLRRESDAASGVVIRARDASDIESTQRRIAIDRLETISIAALAICGLFAALQAGSLWVAQSRYEQALTESERQHRAIVEDQSELISLSRPDGTLEFVNPAYAKFFRFSTQDLAGRSLYDSLPAEERAVVAAQIAAAGVGNEPLHREQHLPADASHAERWIAWHHRPQADGDGKVLVHSVGREITLRKRAEQGLRSREDFLRRIGRVAGIGGWTFDLATQTAHWSPEVRKIHEVPDDFTPKLDEALSFYAPEAQKQITRAIAKAVSDGTPYDLELQMVTQTGKAIWVRAVGELECDDSGRAVRLIGALQNITQRKHLEQRLEARERFLQTIADNVPMRIAYIDRAYVVRFANAQFCAAIGQSQEQIRGRVLGVLHTDAAGPGFAERIAAGLSGEACRFERVESRRARLRDLETHLVPDRDVDGEIRGLFIIDVDITHLKRIERSLRELTEVFDNTPDFIAQTDAHGRMHYLNPAARRAAGFEPEASLASRDYREFYTLETRQRFAEEILPVVRERGVWVGETQVSTHAGPVPVSHMVIAHRDDQGQVSRYTSLMRDISAEVVARRELARRTSMLNAIVEAIPAILAVWDTDMRYQVVNKAFERWRGRGREQFLGRTLEQAIGAREFEFSRPWVERALAGETVVYDKDYPDRQEYRHMSVSYSPLRLEDGSIGGFVGVAQDITRHREERLRLVDLSQHDPLTGLLNRAGLESYLVEKIARGEGASLAVVYIDLDHFKPINDRYGHAMGDEVLRQFADRVKKLVRPSDAVARLGGDEFAVALAGVREPRHAATVADKIVESAATPFDADGLSLRIGASVGVDYDASLEDGWKGLIARADAKAYEAKAAGRGRRVVGGFGRSPLGRGR